MANANFQNLNFDSIRASIKTKLSSVTEFQDHNFEGSTWALILDALAYGAHYTGVYSNFALSEAFLDTAELRSSVISRAKELGYVPRQVTAAQARILLAITGQTTGQSLTVAAGTKFSASLDNQSYTFQTINNFNLVEDGATGNYSAEVDIVQGFANTQTFTVSASPSTDRYILFDSDVDTTTITVDVDATDYTLDTNFVNLDGNSLVVFLQETENENVELSFGDNILGKSLTQGQIITVTWLSTVGPDANNIEVFQLDDSVAGFAPALWTLTVLSRASGGAARDSIAKIKFTAPKTFAAQNRLVTAEDYRTLLVNAFPGVKSISVWGGEENVPPLYGKVFVSVSLAGSSSAFDTMTDQMKTDITAFLNLYKMMAIIPELVDPAYLYININSVVTYDNAKTSRTPAQVQADVKTAIQSYIATTLQVFGGKLRMSKLLAAMDAVDVAIADSLVDITLERQHTTPATTVPSNLTIDFSSNRIDAGSFKSSKFNVNQYYKDDGLGFVWLYTNDIKAINASGTIDYVTSVVTLNNVPFVTNVQIIFTATPTDSNISSLRLNILDEGSIVVNTQLAQSV